MAGIPVLMAEGDCIARAWENALVLLHASGCDIKTQYDKPDDPPSKDATMIVTIHDPLAEPMIHRDFPGGFEELEEYVMEVCDGIKDHCVRDPNDPSRHALGIHVPSAAVPVRGADAGAGRSDRTDLPKVGRRAAHPPGAGDHVEGVGRQLLLRPGVFAEHLVPDHARERPAAAEHERPLPLERRLQGGLHEHVRLDASASENRRADRRSFRASRSGWAATATLPTVFTFTGRILPSSRRDFSARSRSARSSGGRCVTKTCARSWKPPGRRFWRKPGGWAALR